MGGGNNGSMMQMGQQGNGMAAGQVQQPTQMQSLQSMMSAYGGQMQQNPFMQQQPSGSGSFNAFAGLQGMMPTAASAAAPSAPSSPSAFKPFVTAPIAQPSPPPHAAAPAPAANANMASALPGQGASQQQIAQWWQHNMGKNV